MFSFFGKKVYELTTNSLKCKIVTFSHKTRLEEH